jgi:hypothetical protein
VNRETLATLPTVSGRHLRLHAVNATDLGREFVRRARRRLNNMTINRCGASTTRSASRGQPGGTDQRRANLMEAIEQVQVSIAPYDVRQGNFVGASVDTVTRSGTNSLRAATYYRFRNDAFVGTEARGNVFNPGTFDTKQTGVWSGAPDRQEPVVRVRQLRK